MKKSETVPERENRPQNNNEEIRRSQREGMDRSQSRSSKMEWWPVGRPENHSQNSKEGSWQERTIASCVYTSKYTFYCILFFIPSILYSILVSLLHPLWQSRGNTEGFLSPDDPLDVFYNYIMVCTSSADTLYRVGLTWRYVVVSSCNDKLACLGSAGVDVSPDHCSLNLCWNVFNLDYLEFL